MNVRQAANYAEIITSPQFVDAKNSTMESNPDCYGENMDVTYDILGTALETHRENVSPNWDIRRLAANRSIYDESFRTSPIYSHLTLVRGVAKATMLEQADLPPGESEPVYTNYLIKNLYDSGIPSVDFLDEAITLIKKRNATFEGSIGTENFATTIKYFADCVTNEREWRHVDSTTDPRLPELLKSWTQGFTRITEKDQPNFVEMTNVYVAITKLPDNLFPPEFTKIVVAHSLEAIPTFHRKVALILLSAIGKLNPTESPVELAVLTDLTIDMIGQFERTDELRTALRAMRVLRPSPVTNKALRTIYENTYGLEDPLDIEGLFGTSESLRVIAERTIDDPELTIKTKDLAKRCALNAVTQYKEAEQSGLSKEQLKYLEVSVRKIVSNYDAI